jgi:hypothetical protein
MPFVFVSSGDIHPLWHAERNAKLSHRGLKGEEA